MRSFALQKPLSFFSAKNGSGLCIIHFKIKRLVYCDIVIGRKKVEGKNWFNFNTTEQIFLKLCIPLSITHTNPGKEIQNFSTFQ